MKPRTKEQLIQGIAEFWESVDNKCLKYIGHLGKVILKVIDMEGAAIRY